MPWEHDVSRASSECTVWRDLQWFLRVAQVFGWWPFSKRNRVIEDRPAGKGEAWTRAWTDFMYLQTQTPQEVRPRWELSWRSFSAYLHLFNLVVFVAISSCHLANTLLLAADDSLDISKKVVSLPWFATAVLPVASSVVILVRARTVTKMLCSWQDLGFRIGGKLGRSADHRYARFVMAAYVTMAFASLGLLLHQRFFGQAFHAKLGFNVPEPWSCVVDIAQHICILGIWAGYLVPEALLLVAAHHLTSHYRAVNIYFTQVLERLADGKLMPVAGNYMKKARLEAARQEMLEAWELYGEVDSTLSLVNRVFSPINLINVTMYMIMICGLLVPPMKSHDLVSTSGQVGNAVLAMFRLVILLLGQAKVNEELASTRILVSRRHTQLVMGGLYIPEVVALLDHMASGEGRGISAWGFFVVRKGTLLTYFSFLVSYVVIMLQA